MNFSSCMKFCFFCYFQLLYVDGLRFERMDVPRTRPAICFWCSEMIRVREDYEMIDGGFGLGEVNAELDIDDEKSEEVIYCIHL